jgi:hypothetical protein
MVLNIPAVGEKREKRVTENACERRRGRRYEVSLGVQYAVSQGGESARSDVGTTVDMSTSGVSFRCHRVLPVGAHIQLVLDWPALHEGTHSIELHANGFVVRSDKSCTAVRLTWHKLFVRGADQDSLAS